MKRMLAVLLCTAMLVSAMGCSRIEKPISSEEPSVSAAESSLDDSSSEPDSLQEPPLTEEEWETPLPDFLNETQQELYLRAKVIYSAISVDTTNIDDSFGGTSDGESVEIDGMRYKISNGRYAQWDDFMAMMRPLFTEECIAQRLGTDLDEPYFLEHDGRLCYIEAARGSLPGHLEPDEYELISKTEEEIIFNIIGHYVPLGGGEVYTKSFPIRMVNTEDGWRFAEFNITL